MLITIIGGGVSTFGKVLLVAAEVGGGIALLYIR